jgi:hypothetical protein
MKKLFFATTLTMLAALALCLSSCEKEGSKPNNGQEKTPPATVTFDEANLIGNWEAFRVSSWVKADSTIVEEEERPAYANDDEFPMDISFAADKTGSLTANGQLSSFTWTLNGSILTLTEAESGEPAVIEVAKLTSSSLVWVLDNSKQEINGKIYEHYAEISFVKK